MVLSTAFKLPNHIFIILAVEGVLTSTVFSQCCLAVSLNSGCLNIQPTVHMLVDSPLPLSFDIYPVDASLYKTKLKFLFTTFTIYIVLKNY